MFASFGALLAGAAYFASSAAAQTADPIVVNGKHFFWKTNQTEFFIRGIAYQQDYDGNATTSSSNVTYVDPLANTANCLRDIPYLVALRTNVIRTYAIDPTQDHSGCMNALAAAGIYVISDLSSPSESINRDSPAWTVDLLERYTSVISNLAQYTNTIGFFAGNEVSNTDNTTAASAFVKAAVRDSKAYIAANVNRPLYVGYATYDGPIRDQLAQYFNCGDQSAAIDFWGYNVYSWCGNSTYAASGYDARTTFFQDYSVPVFFAEYGCNNEDGAIIVRPFTEVAAIFGSNMTGVWSGGIVYQYFQSTAEYGLINLNGNTVKTTQDYENLSKQMASASPASTAYSAINSGTPTTCPTVDTTIWAAKATPLPPTPNSNLCGCMTETLSCVVNNSTSSDDYGDLFNYICDPSTGNYCGGIAANATTGQYGAYGMCSAEQQLDFVLNQYYVGQQSQNSNNFNPSACAFSGQATTQKSTSATGTCSSLVAAAGTNGANTVTGTVASSSTSKSGASGGSRAVFGGSYLFVGLYVFGAIATGTGAVLL